METRWMLWILLLTLAFAAPAAATNLTGTFHHPDGSPVNGKLIFLLSQPARLSDGAAQVVPRVRIFNVVNGALESGAFLYGNDALLPAGTHYLVRLVDAGNNLLFEQKWFIQGEDLNLNTLTPTTIGVALPDPLVKNVIEEQSVEGPVTFTGGLTTYSLTLHGNLLPGSDDLYVLGAPEFTWRAAYLRDLHTRNHPWYDVRAFGAVCDGVTDDSAVIQGIVNTILATSRRTGVIKFPVGSCNLGTATIEINAAGTPATVWFEGVANANDVARASILTCNVAGPCLDFHNGGGNQAIRGGGVRNLSVINTNTTTAGQSIRSNSSFNFTVENAFAQCRGVCVEFGALTFSGKFNNLRVNGQGVSLADNVGLKTYQTFGTNYDGTNLGIAYHPVGTNNSLAGFRMEVNQIGIKFGDGVIGCLQCAARDGSFEANATDVDSAGGNFSVVESVTSNNATTCVRNIGNNGRVQNYSCGGNHNQRNLGEPADDTVLVPAPDSGNTMVFEQVNVTGTPATGKALWNPSSAALSSGRVSFCNTNAHLTVSGVRCLSQETMQAPVLQSTVATGTAPLTVASTTEVTNLNAQLWGGKKALDFSGALDFSEIAAQNCGEMTLSVTGAAADNPVAASWPASLEAGLTGMMRVSAADTVTVRLCNVTGSPINPTSHTFAGRVLP